MFPSFTTKSVTHWPAAPDGYGGFAFGTPVEIQGRWDNSIEKMSDSNGEEFVSKTVVYLESAISEGDYLFEGVSVAADPTAVTGAKRVHKYDETPDIRYLQTVRRAFLQ